MPARSRSSSLSRTSLSLVSLAESLSRSGSRLEDLWWQQALSKTLTKVLGGRAGHSIEHALEHLLQQRSPAYELLVEHAEAYSESFNLTHDNQPYDVQLISAPVLAWTRYQLPAAQLTDAHLQALSDAMSGIVLAPGAQLQLLPHWVRFDQLPQSFRETRTWATEIAQHSLGTRRDLPGLPPADTPEDLLADAYFLIGVVIVPQGQALFKWQDTGENSLVKRTEVASQWAQACVQAVEPLFTGCLMEYLLPEAFYTATRQADQSIRPLTLKAAITWLQTAAHIAATYLRAAIVGCGEQAIEEYRIGFCTRKNNDVIYGCVWPSLSREEATPDLSEAAEGEVDTWDTLAALLRESGIQDIRRLPGLHPLEFCDDCGTPYFPNMLGEMQHPELPEEIDPEPVQFH